MVFSVLMQSELHAVLSLAAFLIPVFAALRLAKFNLDERQSTSFLGLPVPANAIFWGGLLYSYAPFFAEEPWLLCALVLLFCTLMVAEIPMFSLKMKSAAWRHNKVQYIYLLGCVVLLATMWDDAFAPIIAWYIAFSIVTTPKSPKGDNIATR